MHKHTTHRRPVRKVFTKAAVLFALALATALLSGCAAVGGGVSQMQDEETSKEETTQPGTTASTGDEPEATQAGGDERAGGSSGGSGETGAAPGRDRPERENAGGPGAQAGPGEAVLRLTGTRGVKFSGECTVAGEARSVEGETPERLDFALDGGNLECEIEKQDPGQLRVVFTTENNNVTQTTSADETTLNLVYENGSVSLSQASSSGAGSRQSSSTSVSQSNVVVQTGPNSD